MTFYESIKSGLYFLRQPIVASIGGEVPIKKNRLVFYWDVLRESIAKFFSEDMPAHAAALSYYMVFSLPSMLFIVFWITAKFYKEDAVRDAISSQIGSLVGEEGARQIMATLGKLNFQEPSSWVTAVGLGMLLFFATTVFDAMRTALNRLRQVKTAGSFGIDIWKLVRIRFIAFAMLVSISFILLVSLVMNAIITEIGRQLSQWIGKLAVYLMVFDAMLLDLGATTVLFAMYFRYLPDAKLKWQDTLFGALLTAVVFTGGKYLIAIFIGNSEVADLYDAAGSILVLMLWVYYASAIFLFGATFTFTRAELMSNGQEMSEKDAGIKK